MRKILFNLKWFYIIALMVLFFSNCSNWVKMGVTSSSQYSLIPTEGLTSSNIPNEQFFYINLKSSYYVGKGFDPLDAIIYSMEDGPGTDCKIPVSEESSEDLYCIMDIMEGDLWLNELVLEYNIPQGMCDYFSFRVPWHFNQLIGNGPKNVYEIEEFKIGGFEGEDTDKQAKVETRYCLGGFETTPIIPAVPSSEFPKDICGTSTTTNNNVRPGPEKDIKDFCGKLDQSESGLANCCLGTYTLHKAGGGIEKGEWGGNFKDCIGGLARISAVVPPTSAGIPKGKITQVKGDGLREEYQIPALINVYDGHIKKDAVSSLGRPSFITANYWENVREKDFKSTKPQIYKTPVDLDDKPPSFELSQQATFKYTATGIKPYPYLTWTCLDRAREIKHRINLVIREWNTQEEYNLFKDSEGGSGDPNIAGTEGNECDYYENAETLSSDTQCNDLDSVDDFESDNSKFYDSNYPNIIYK